MIHASQERGAITLPMLLGHVAPLCYRAQRGPDAPSREYHYPANASRGERRALRMRYIVEFLRDAGAATCAELAHEFGVITEAIYKDLMLMKAEGAVAILPGTRPARWEACDA